MGAILDQRGLAADSGQAAIESAIILPLYVFLILGILQLGMMHQARLMTKYAAYRAVRAGSLHNANVKVMEKEALAVLLPMISQRSGSGGAEIIKPVNSASRFVTKLVAFQNNSMSDGDGLKYAEVTVCGPTTKETGKSAGEIDFDDPKDPESQWGPSEKGKLRIQVTFNYRLPIPFADYVIVAASRNQAVPFVLRLGRDGKDKGRASNSDKYWGLAQKGLFVLPIRATYTMRMQSNVYASNLPSTNKCVFAWK
jgi:hypothetical protein